MKRSFEATLLVNKAPVDLNPFVEEFLSRTVAGAVSSLKGADDIQRVELYLEQGNATVIVNGDKLPLTPFPNDLIANTVVGLVSSLKGVDNIDSLAISMKTQ